MKAIGYIAAISAGLVLVSCNNEAEETPDITEAIPIDEASEGEDAETDTNAENGEGDSRTPDTPALPENSNSQTQGARESERDLPATMESGSNSGDQVIDLEGSKLQRAD